MRNFIEGIFDHLASGLSTKPVIRGRRAVNQRLTRLSPAIRDALGAAGMRHFVVAALLDPGPSANRLSLIAAISTLVSDAWLASDFGYLRRLCPKKVSGTLGLRALDGFCTRCRVPDTFFVQSHLRKRIRF